MWFSKGMRTSTSAIRSTMTNDVSAISGMHPKCGAHLLAILKGEKTLSPRCLVTEDEGTVEMGSVKKVPRLDPKTGKPVMKSDGTGYVTTVEIDDPDSFVDDPGGVGQAVLDPKASYAELDSPRNGASDKYKRKQYFQSMYWIVCCARMEEGRGILNGDDVIREMYENDKKAFQKYYEELAKNEDLCVWLCSVDDTVDSETGPVDAFGGNVLDGGAADYAGDFGAQANGSTVSEGVETDGVSGEDDGGMDDGGEEDDGYDETREELVDDFSRRIYDIGSQYESVVTPAWFKSQALKFINQLRNKYVDGIPQLLGGSYNLTFRDFFTTTGDRNLWYGINHYPPMATGWVNKPMLRRALYATDKQRTMLRRAKAVRDMFNIDMVRHQAGRGQATVKTL